MNRNANVDDYKEFSSIGYGCFAEIQVEGQSKLVYTPIPVKCF